MGERPADSFPESLPAFQRMFPTDLACAHGIERGNTCCP